MGRRPAEHRGGSGYKVGPCGPLVLCHSPTWILKVTSGWKQPPQPLSCAVYARHLAA